VQARDNVRDLRLAWRWSARNFGPRPPNQMQVSPPIVDGVMYTTAGVKRDVVALDAATGQLLWHWRPTGELLRWSDTIDSLARSSGRGLTLYTPSSLPNTPDGTLGTLTAPSRGRVNWSGGAADPVDDVLYVTTQKTLYRPIVVEGRPGTGVLYHDTRGSQGAGPGRRCSAFRSSSLPTGVLWLST
jgi:outer membrane protein assembly factor BamB